MKTEKIIAEILKQASTINKKINGWDVEIKTHITRGSDSTEVMTIKISNGDVKIELQEFQGIVKIDWKVKEQKLKNIPASIPISNFAGANKTKELDALLSGVGAPTWTQLEKIYEEHQER